MNIIVVTPPAFAPVSVADTYRALRWDPEITGSPPETIYPLEALIQGHIETSTQEAEAITRRALIKQTLRITLPGFPSTRSRFGARWDEDDFYFRPGKIELKRPPFIGPVSVNYLDKDEVLQTLDPANYYVDQTSDIVAMLVFRDTFDVGIATCERTDAVQIEWVAGYPYGDDAASPLTQENAAANVPQRIKDAILIGVQLLADRFDPDERDNLTRARDALLNQLKVNSF